MQEDPQGCTSGYDCKSRCIHQDVRRGDNDKNLANGVHPSETLQSDVEKTPVGTQRNVSELEFLGLSSKSTSNRKLEPSNENGCDEDLEQSDGRFSKISIDTIAESKRGGEEGNSDYSVASSKYNLAADGRHTKVRAENGPDAELNRYEARSSQIWSDGRVTESDSGRDKSHFDCQDNASDGTYSKFTSLLRNSGDEDLEQLEASFGKISFGEIGEAGTERRFDLLGEISRRYPNVMLKILRFVEIKDLVHKVSLVSKSWHNMAFDPALWSRIDLRGYVANDRVMSKIPQICNFITYVWLPDGNNEDFTNDGLITLAKGCPLLKTFIAPRTGAKFSDEAITAFTEHCLRLEKMYLDAVDFSDSTLYKIGHNLDQLKVLSICQVSSITNEGVAEIFRSCRNLQELFVSQNQQITDDCFSGIPESSKSLRRLEVMMCRIKPSGVPLLAKLHNLEVLNLTQCTELTAEHLLPVLKGCTRLNSLALNLNKSVDDECVYLILTHLPRLTSIYLVSTIITDKAMDIMGWKGKCLEHVDLGYTKVTEVGARRISEKCPTLNYLGLMRCDKIPESVVEELVIQYPHITYSTFVQDAKRLLKRIEEEKEMERKEEESEEKS